MASSSHLRPVSSLYPSLSPMLSLSQSVSFVSYHLLYRTCLVFYQKLGKFIATIMMGRVNIDKSTWGEGNELLSHIVYISKYVGPQI